MSENKKFLEGCEKLADGRYRIHEKMTVTPIKCKEPIKCKKRNCIGAIPLFFLTLQSGYVHHAHI